MVSSGVVKLPDWTGVSKTALQIPVRDGTTLRAVLYRPSTAPPGPLAVYFHGGGWTFGWPEAWEHGIEVLVKELGIAVVGVAYRLAPEWAFPTAVHDAVDSLVWCGVHAGVLGARSEEGVVVVGTSAGGNLAAAAVHEVVEEKGEEEVKVRVRGLVLMGAGLVHSQAVPREWRAHYRSWEENRDASVLDRRGVEWFLGEFRMLSGGKGAELTGRRTV